MWLWREERTRICPLRKDIWEAVQKMHLSVLFPRSEHLPSKEEMAVESHHSFYVFHLAPFVFRLSSQLWIGQKKLCSTPTPVTHKLGAVLELRAWFSIWSLPVLSLPVMPLSRLGSELHPFQCWVWHSDMVKEPGLLALAECTTFGRLLAASEGTWGDFYGSWITMILSMRAE